MKKITTFLLFCFSLSLTGTVLVGQESQLTPQLLEKIHLFEPFWSSPIVYGDSLFFLQEEDEGPIRAQLLFQPKSIRAVRSSNGLTTYEEGKDYKVLPDSRTLELLPDSRIPFTKRTELYPKAGSENAYAHKVDDPQTFLLYGPTLFPERQVEVDYNRVGMTETSGTTEMNWDGYVPKYAEKLLPKTIARLQKKEPFVLCTFGDSISVGGDCSQLLNLPPYQPCFANLFAEGLRTHFDLPVKHYNYSVGGMNSSWGVENAARIAEIKPDLVLIGFGMNDVGYRNPELFRSRIAEILTIIKKASPETEFILISPMLGNPEWIHTPREMFDPYRDSLVSLCEEGVALADLTQMWIDLCQRKKFLDLVSNGLNHINDFGHRIYAQVLLGLLVPSLHPQ
ncbi:MAG: SGNH/GDSL hydrolase family protein [Thermoguttaceae bacterium]